MNEYEYYETGCGSYKSEFTFADGSVEVGVLTNWFAPNDRNYYLVRNNVLREFKALHTEGNFEKARTFATLINLDNLIKAKCLISKGIF